MRPSTRAASPYANDDIANINSLSMCGSRSARLAEQVVVEVWRGIGGVGSVVGLEVAHSATSLVQLNVLRQLGFGSVG
jgi:hypothetical protein